MFNSKYSNILTVVLVIAIIAIIFLIGYFGYDIYNKYYTNKKNNDAVDAWDPTYSNTNTNKKPTNNIGDIPNITIDGVNQTNPSNTTNSTQNGGTAVVKQKYEGFTVAGSIEISKINLKYFILEETSKNALEKAVCLQYGKLNKVGNAVIIGHNYRNGTFFSNLTKLSNGDTITITDYTGEKVKYTVYSIFQAEPEDMTSYTRATNGAREITLVTCNDDSSMRTIVLAKEN